MPNDTMTNDAGGAMQDFARRLDLDTWFAKINQSPATFAAVCFGGGFALGFLFKRFFKFLLFTLLIAFGVITFLHYKNMVIVDWVALSQYIGLDPEQIRLATAIEVTWHWVSHHSLAAISTVAGFVVGYKIG